MYPFNPDPIPNQKEVVLVDRLDADGNPIKIRYFDNATSVDAPVLLLLHGSPMASETFDAFYEAVDSEVRMLAPDLPGLGRSSWRIDDYSIQRHAQDMISFLDTLSVRNVHLLGYSMGGGVAIHIAEELKERVESVTLVSAIGAQEYELLGDYTLNHAIHAMQLVFLQGLDWFLPHFGVMDDMLLNVRYARNFYDTDQRPLADLLSLMKMPTLIVHGEKDFQVPEEAAREHHRLIQNSAYIGYENSGHLLIYRHADLVAQDVLSFLSSVGSDEFAPDRSMDYLLSDEPYPLPRNDTLAAVLLGLATFASEDLACIGAGVLSAKGAVGLEYAIIGCLLGIFVGDLGIYFIGRILGQSALGLPIIRSMLTEDKVARYSGWFDRKGFVIIIWTRFLPGTRVATYFAAGLVKASAVKFSLALLLASAIWTPVIVLASYWLGGAFLQLFEEHEKWLLMGLLACVVGLLLLVRILAGAMTWRGRRLLLSRWKRLTHWEFWPAWAVYPPVIVYILASMIRHRSFTVFTALNPCMPASGLVYESKSQILTHLAAYGSPVGRFRVIPLDIALDEKLAALETFMVEEKLTYPIVLKPDVGQRGQGVKIVDSQQTAETFFHDQCEDTVVQEFLPGREYGLFYYRYPEEVKGHLLSVTDKRFTSVVGDGASTLERLILMDDRAVCMARFFLKEHAAELDHVLEKGERFALANLGTHCQGAMFLDGSHLMTPKLQEAVDRMSRDVEGFYFGRYDVRVPSEESLKAGEDIRIIELNGLTSESTNMYDPKHGWIFAVRTLINQWRLIFEISVRNRKKGAKVTPLARVISMVYHFLRGHDSSGPA